MVSRFISFLSLPQGRRDSNPQPPVLETGALPIEPLPFDPGQDRCRAEKPTTTREGGFLASFLVEGVLPVKSAVFLHLNALSVVDLVLHRDVVTPLALLAREGDLDSLLVLCHRDLPFLLSVLHLHCPDSLVR